VWLSVSLTTRAARAGEIDGVHYHFVTEPEFDQLIVDGALLEWAQYTTARYGTLREPVERTLTRGMPVLLEIDLAGARQVSFLLPEATLVFLRPPSWEDLTRRLTGRGTEDSAAIARRLQRAREEMDAEGECDVTIVNHAGKVDAAAAQLLDLIKAAELPLPESATRKLA
jgi:guanylate kinase